MTDSGSELLATTIFCRGKQLYIDIYIEGYIVYIVILQFKYICNINISYF